MIWQDLAMSIGGCMESYMTANEVAAFVKLSLQTIRRLTMKKEIPFHKINRSVRYKPVEIQAWVEKREHDSKEAARTMFDDVGGIASNDGIASIGGVHD